MTDETFRQCPKCLKFSGDDWSQCGGACPLVDSPDFLPVTRNKYGPPKIMNSQEMHDAEQQRWAIIHMEDEEIPF